MAGLYYGAFALWLIRQAEGGLSPIGISQTEFIYTQEPQPIGTRRPFAHIDEEQGECDLPSEIGDSPDPTLSYAKVEVAAPLITVPTTEMIGDRRLKLTGICPSLAAEKFTCSADKPKGELKANFVSFINEVQLDVVPYVKNDPVHNGDQTTCAGYLCVANTVPKHDDPALQAELECPLATGGSGFEHECSNDFCCKGVTSEVTCFLKEIALVLTDNHTLTLRFDYDECRSFEGEKRASVLLGLKPVPAESNDTANGHANVKYFFQHVCPDQDWETEITRTTTTPNYTNATDEPPPTPIPEFMVYPWDLELSRANLVKRSDESPVFPCFAHTVDAQYVWAPPGCFQDFMMFTAKDIDGVNISTIPVPEDQYYELVKIAKELKEASTILPEENMTSKDPCAPMYPGVPAVIVNDQMCVQLPGCSEGLEDTDPRKCNNHCGTCQYLNDDTGTTTTKPPVGAQCVKCFWMEMLLFTLLALSVGCCALFCDLTILQQHRKKQDRAHKKITDAKEYKNEEFNKQAAMAIQYDRMSYSMDNDGPSGMETNADPKKNRDARSPQLLPQRRYFCLACILMQLWCLLVLAFLITLFETILNDVLQYPSFCPCHVWPEKVYWALACSGVACWSMFNFYFRRRLEMKTQFQESFRVDRDYGPLTVF